MKQGGTTTQRGYGWAHQKARALAIEAYRQGDPCSRCRQPMRETDPSLLHYDHEDDRSGYRGLSHRSCNCRAGQAKAMATVRRNAPTKIVRSESTRRSRNW